MKTADGKEIMVKDCFNEVCYMFDWLEKHPEYKMVDYKFTFQFGYILYYTEKSQSLDWDQVKITRKE